MPNLKRERESKRNFSQILKITLTSLIAAFACAGVIYAATTVGSNISTDGTITGSGINTLYGATSIGGALTATSTLTVTGNSIFSTASSTGIVKFSQINSDTGAISFGDENLSTTGTLNITGLTTLGNASTTLFSVSGNSYLAATTVSGGLTVTGNLNMSADKILKYNSINMAYSGTDGYSFFFGGAGSGTPNVGSNDTAIGRGAMAVSAAGANYNTALGTWALTALTDADGSTAVGSYALASITGQGYLTAVGYNALRYNTSGSANVALGASALTTNTTGSSNLAIGYQSLYNNIGGSGNIGIGVNAMVANRNGILNTAIGNDALGAICTTDCDVGTLAEEFGSYNVAIGRQALRVSTTGKKNTAVGQASMYNSITGNWNTSIGEDNMYNAFSGDNNTSVGRSGMIQMTTGQNNTSLGTDSLYNNQIGSGNVALGYRAGSFETGSNAFYVDNQNRTDTAGDKAGALLYGTFNATPASQTLKINAVLGLRPYVTGTDTQPTCDVSRVGNIYLDNDASQITALCLCSNSDGAGAYAWLAQGTGTCD